MIIQVLLEHIKVRWLSLFRSIERLVQNYEPIKLYFLAQQTPKSSASTKIQTNQRVLKLFFESDESLCVLYFLHNVLGEIQLAELQLQRSYTTVVDLHRIITRLINKLQQRQADKLYGQGTRQLLKQIKTTNEEGSVELECSFKLFIDCVIEYIKSYYDENSAFFETVSHFGLHSNEFLSWESVIAVADQFQIETLNIDELYSEYCELKITYQELQKTTMALSGRVKQYISSKSSSTTTTR